MDRFDDPRRFSRKKRKKDQDVVTNDKKKLFTRFRLRRKFCNESTAD